MSAPADVETLSPFQQSLRICVRAGYPLLYLAFAEGAQASLRDEHLAQAIAHTVPLSHSMRDRVDRLRQAATQWRLASDPVEQQEPEAAAIVEPPAPASKPRRIFET